MSAAIKCKLKVSHFLIDKKYLLFYLKVNMEIQMLHKVVVYYLLPSIFCQGRTGEVLKVLGLPDPIRSGFKF